MTNISIKSWWLRHLYLGRGVVLGGIAILILILMIIPSWQKVGEVGSKIRVREKEEQALLSKVQILSNLKSETLAEKLAVLDRALPPRNDVVLYLSTIDGLSKELGLSFAGISLNPGDVTEATTSGEVAKPKTETKEGLRTLETEIQITGPQERIYDFLRALENSTPLMQVKDVKVSKIGSEGEMFSLALRLAMLWAPGEVENVKGALTLFTPKEEEYFAKLAEFKNYAVMSLFNNPADDEGLGKIDLFSAISQPTESPEPAPQEEVPLSE